MVDFVGACYAGWVGVGGDPDEELSETWTGIFE